MDDAPLSAESLMDLAACPKASETDDNRASCQVARQERILKVSVVIPVEVFHRTELPSGLLMLMIIWALRTWHRIICRLQPMY